MGQRLTITFLESNGEPIATLYQHWGGYTSDALDEANDIGKGLVSLGLLEETRPAKREQMLIKYLIDNYYPNIKKEEVAGLSSWDNYMTKAKKIECYKTLIADELPIKRNVGLVEIDPKRMEIAQEWAVINMTINLNDLTFDPRELFCESYSDSWYDEDNVFQYAFNNAPILGDDLYRLQDITTLLKRLKTDRFFRFNRDNEALYELIGD